MLSLQHPHTPNVLHDSRLRLETVLKQSPELYLVNQPELLQQKIQQMNLTVSVPYSPGQAKILIGQILLIHY